ncbi:hypothetical protein SAMN04487868_10388 [Marinobacter salarius]|jgi:hypothetical protein|uniref:Uncharacterized protein n=2 Tax=Marinobacter TaxID=2742 RepID=A0ABY1FKM5_9GAMM|nr:MULTISPECIES: hypothetical protein [Marinobacter]KXJ46764.1 MAG: hypothetical protein AXW11_02830 [Marinobacter sp. Hex_13]MBS8231899.1 hypothetical protein [Marinobacter salarius]SFL50788.1 hypothetical protein SAMN04487868_10388 [Marinobacter salarius]|tara:strand:- start:410 stop:976 length:567 start_codon:yes stop_codon:yes gene_type:complete
MIYRSALFFLLFCLSLNSALGNEAIKFQYEKKDYGPTLMLASGLVGRLNVPVAELEGAKIIPGAGITVMFPDRSYFSLEILTSEDFGYKGVDIRSWPLYLFGIKESGPEPESYISELKKSKKFVIDLDISPEEVRIFDTSSGTGYWAFGKKKSFIVLVDKDKSDQILVIKTESISGERIERLIINGVI